MSALPIVVHGERVHALVVGGGAVGTRKALALLDAGATVRVIAPSLSAALHACAERCDRLTLVERAFQDADVGSAHLVIAATDVRAVNAAVAAAAHAAARMVNVADRPDEGTYVNAATHRAGDLVIAVATGGVPSAAARIRDALAARFDSRYATALDALRTLRAKLLADAASSERWASARTELTGADFVAAVEDGTFADRVRSWA